MEPHEKTVIITGASSGIGAETARLLAADGAFVVLGARRGDLLDEIVAGIRDAGGRAVSRVTDVAHGPDLQRLVDLAVEESGRLDVLVANAGVTTNGPIAEQTMAQWDAMIDVNLRGVLHGIAAALPRFRAQGSGHFVTVTSTSAAKWVPGQGVYAATKAGVRALCEILRQEVGPEIRVSMVRPGATDTAFAEPEVRERFSEVMMPADAVARAIAYAIAQPAAVDIGEIVVRSARQP